MSEGGWVTSGTEMGWEETPRLRQQGMFRAEKFGVLQQFSGLSRTGWKGERGECAGGPVRERNRACLFLSLSPLFCFLYREPKEGEFRSVNCLWDSIRHGHQQDIRLVAAVSFRLDF